jgi:hypothetical protein
MLWSFKSLHNFTWEVGGFFNLWGKRVYKNFEVSLSIGISFVSWRACCLGGLVTCTEGFSEMHVFQDGGIAENPSVQVTSPPKQHALQLTKDIPIDKLTSKFL